MKKFLIILFLLVLIPNIVFGQDLNSDNKQFQAKVVDVSDTFVRLENKDGERFTISLNEANVLYNKYHKGDNVFVEEIEMVDAESIYIITDIVRKKAVYFLIFLFIVLVLGLYRKKGFRALFSLFFTILIIVFFVAPLILKGANPLVVTIFGAVFLLFFSLYITYGFNKKTHSAFIGTLISIIIGGFLSYFFVKFASLSGFIAEEASYIVSLGYTEVDMRGLLLAAIIIGMLGVLDDVTVSQASIVNELHETNNNLSKKEIYKKAMRVGHDHVGSMINTLLFAYIGASFPLFLLFIIGQPPFDTLGGILNNEIVATEIVRTLVGSIALILSVPITTFVAVKFLKK